MTLEQEIREDLKYSISNDHRITRDLLRVVISEIDYLKKNKIILTDDEIIYILRKMCNDAKLCGTTWEIPILETYIPKKINESIVKSLVQNIIRLNNYKYQDIGKIMAASKIGLQDDFEGKMVLKIIKEILLIV